MLYPSSAYNAESDAATAFAVCNTDGDQQVKGTTINGFVPYEGAMVSILFYEGNTANNPILRIYSTYPSVYTEYPMLGMGNDMNSKIKGHLLSDSPYDTWGSGAIVSFVFRNKLDTSIPNVEDPTANGGWVMVNAPQILRHSVYRPGNKIKLSNTYWPGLVYKQNGKLYIDIQFQFPYEISDGSIPFIPEVNAILVNTSIPFEVYPNVINGVALNSASTNPDFDGGRGCYLSFNKKLGMMKYKGYCSDITTSFTDTPVLVWFPSSNLEFEFTAGNT